ncbi:MAG: DUF3465 domain-containing protein [Gammaproteobacteria bacterium]|nr:DUF3465 domain-containing protein [Gammaproteobacteria bacterium]
MTRQIRALIGIVAAAAVAWFGYSAQNSEPSATPAAPVSVSDDTAGIQATRDKYSEAAEQIVSAFESQRSDMWIEGGGRVQRVLADDSEGSRHQRFIVSLANEHTILIAHNIDLAQRVPLKAGDEVSFYGEYEWNDRGGVIHWTHHNPRNRREGGWIQHKGTTYR